jgi:hypothetical protein
MDQPLDENCFEVISPSHEALVKSSLAPAAQLGSDGDAAFADAAIGYRGVERLSQ